MRQNCFLLLLLLFVGSLSAQIDPEPVVTTGHKSQINTVDFSPDGRFLASGSLDNFIKIWDLNLRQEFRTLFGHKAGVKKVRFSPDGKTIVSQANDNTLLVFNHPDGELLYRTPVYGECFTISDDSKSLYVFNFRKGLIRLNLQTGGEEKAWKNIQTRAFVIQPDNKTLIGSAVGDSSAWWNLETGDRLHILPGFSAAMAIARNADGSSVALASPKGEVNIYDANSATLLHTYSSKDALFFKSLRYGTQGKYLYALDMKMRVHEISLKNGKRNRFALDYSFDPTKVAEIMKKDGYLASLMPDLALSPDGKYIGTGLQQSEMVQNSTSKGANSYNIVRLTELKTGRTAGEFRGTFRVPTWLRSMPGGKYLLQSDLSNPMGIRVWNLEEGTLERVIEAFPYAALSQDASKIAFFEFLPKIGLKLRVYDWQTGEKKIEFGAGTGGMCLEFTPDGKKLFAMDLEVDMKTYQATYTLHRYNLETGKEEAQKVLGTMESGYSLHLSPDGSFLFLDGIASLVTFDANSLEIMSNEMKAGWKKFMGFDPVSGLPVVAHLSGVDGTCRISLVDPKTGEFSATFDPKMKGLIFSGDFSSDGKYLAMGTGGGGASANFAFEVGVMDWSTQSMVCKLKGHHANISLIEFSEDDSQLFSTAGDGMTKIWDWKNCNENATLIAMGGEDYLILDPENYYKSSKGKLEGIGFRYGNQLYGYDQFDLRFNRPDKVMARLGASKLRQKMYKLAWMKRLRRSGFTAEMVEGDLDLPQLTLPGKSELPISTLESSLKLRLEAKDEKHKLDRLLVSVNGVPVYGRDGISLRDQQTQEIEHELELGLTEGLNKISISVMNEKGMESMREAFELSCEAKMAPSRVFMLCLGVGQYDSPQRNLKYAAKDADDLANAGKKLLASGRVESKVLKDGEVSRESVKAAGDWLKQTRPQDLVIVFYSGHGLLSVELDYFLATSNVDFAHPEGEGLPYELLEDLVSNIPARKRLVMIDACHSGEIDKEETEVKPVYAMAEGTVRGNAKAGINAPQPRAGLQNSFAYMQALFADVSSGSGATVISAAGGYEFALESGDWNNGVFTYCLLKGLKDGVADRDGNGKVHVSELTGFVTAKVSELTEGKQVPTSRKENILNDFVLLKVGK